MVNQDRNVFAALMVAQGDADAMVTGLTRSFATCYKDITTVIDTRNHQRAFGVSVRGDARSGPSSSPIRR